jgi:3,5-epimerase/4-reductase
MKNKILIFGKGFIGSRLQEELSCDISDANISSFNEAQEEVEKTKPQVIINCIGFVGRNVDDCELDIDKTLASNTFVPLILGEIAARNNIRLVHLSSGCIYRFDYSKDEPIDESKAPDFFDLYYSRTKIYAERALNALTEKYPILIVRLRIPLDDRPHPRNLLTKLLTFKKVIDVPNSVTYLPDFFRALKHLIEIEATGIYNVVSKGALRYPELLDIYKKYVPGFNYQAIDRKDLNLVRTDLILSTAKLESTGFKIREIHEVLEECVQNYLKY